MSAMKEPLCRRPKYPQPDPQPVLEAARRNRASWLAAMAAVTQSSITEHEREARQDFDEEQFALDSGQDPE